MSSKIVNVVEKPFTIIEKIKKINIRINEMVLSESVVLSYDVLDNTGNVTRTNIVTLTGEDYNNWEEDEYLYTYIANVEGITGPNEQDKVTIYSVRKISVTVQSYEYNFSCIMNYSLLSTNDEILKTSQLVFCRDVGSDFNNWESDDYVFQLIATKESLVLE
jgi:hypothetical protein